MPEIHSSEILCVGTELLLGQIVNTNAAWLARELALAGINSYYQTVVGDNADRLLNALTLASSRSDLVILTGGLGPTQDDLTMATVARFAGRSLQLHEPSRLAIEQYFMRAGRRQVTENNWKQAMMPEGAQVMPNHNGTAPGVILEHATPAGKTVVLILLPGPPSEMQPMFNDSVRPYLAAKSQRVLRNHFVRMIGIGESAAETRLLDLIEQQQNPTLAPYASEGEVMFRITQAAASDAEPDLTGPLLAEVQRRLGEYIYEVGPRSLPEVVKDLLSDRHQTVSFAESCTGGLVSASLTDIPGSSGVFQGSVIAYDNSVKINLLQVSQEIILEKGAVSEDCAIAMASGCRDIMKTDFAVAITGVAGPDGGTPEKPVGLVWLAVAGPKGIKTNRLQIGGNRARVRKVAALYSFDLLRRQIIS